MARYAQKTRYVEKLEFVTSEMELRRIAELDGTWERPNVVTFYHEYDKYGFLSNWYEAPFEFAGNTFPTTEHWMMWQKARLFGDWKTADKVLLATDLNEVKGLGKQVKPYVDKAWSEVRAPVMRVGLRQKFAQNERLLNDLLSTGTAVLAEAAPKDTVWGVGIGAGDPRVGDPAEWRGQNLLGRLLMEVRSELRVASSCGMGGAAWSKESLMRSQLWSMNLLELARMPSTRSVAIMYATFVAQHVPHLHDAHDVLRKVRASIGDIDKPMSSDMGGGLPLAGWHELVDELAMRVLLDGLEVRIVSPAADEEPPRRVGAPSSKERQMEAEVMDSEHEAKAGKATLAAAVWGAAVGDALGVPYEFKGRGTFECRAMVGHGTHDQPAGTWSDDTALMLATCDSIRAVGRVDVDDLLARFRRWYDDGAYTPDGVVFDVGNATAEALRTGRGLDGEWDNGNGSLMRIAPLAFCDATDDEVRAASAVTHAHPTSTEACVEFVHLLREAAADSDGTRERMRSELAGVPRDEVRSGGYVLDTLKAAKWCFANTSSYRDCVLTAVNLGSDTDTTACVAGALAGTAYGMDAIPAEWLDAMRGADVLEATLF